VRLSLGVGRSAFGSDPQGYAAARPQYPDPLYAQLENRCGLGNGSAVFEIGPGTGLATTALLARGANPICGIEPDPRLAVFLRKNIAGRGLQIYECTFEEVQLCPMSFDLGVAATAFHWLEQAPALQKARSLLRAGGWWAMWWTHFGPEGGTDPFQSATNHLFVDTPDSPSLGLPGEPPFALDATRRLDDLQRAGFVERNVDRWSYSATFDTQRLLRLYKTFSPVQALAEHDRAHFLDQLAQIAEQQFGGGVELPLITQLYTARNPGTA
jgi:Methyltransferase domain